MAVSASVPWSCATDRLVQLGHVLDLLLFLFFSATIHCRFDDAQAGDCGMLEKVQC